MTKNRLVLSALTLLIFAVFAAITFLVAGSWQLPFVWTVFGIQAAFGLATLYLLDPDLIAERIRPRGKDEDPLAKVILSILGLLICVVAALDVGRMHISDSVPIAVQIIALVVHALGWAGLLWSMKVNAFFSSAIRLQPDRHQQVISTGPYGWIRHPGYVFASLVFISEGIAFGSWLSLIPAFLIVMDLIYRTILEERILNEGLAGYKEYANHVPYRWLPGLW